MKLSQSNIIAALIIFLTVFLGMQQLQAAEGVTVQQALSMNQQGALLLDVREASEYAEGHAPKAQLIPLGQLSARLPELAAFKDKPIVVICHSGRRSAKGVKILQEAGFSRVSNTTGGMSAWEAAGLEVVRGR